MAKAVKKGKKEVLFALADPHISIHATQPRSPYNVEISPDSTFLPFSIEGDKRQLVREWTKEIGKDFYYIPQS